MHNFLVKLMDKLINEHPDQIPGLLFQFTLIAGFGMFTFSMISWAITNARYAQRSGGAK